MVSTGAQIFIYVTATVILLGAAGFVLKCYGVFDKPTDYSAKAVEYSRAKLSELCVKDIKFTFNTQELTQHCIATLCGSFTSLG